MFLLLNKESETLLTAREDQELKGPRRLHAPGGLFVTNPATPTLALSVLPSALEA